jgi:hypothetical protein
MCGVPRPDYLPVYTTVPAFFEETSISVFPFQATRRRQGPNGKRNGCCQRQDRQLLLTVRCGRESHYTTTSSDFSARLRQFLELLSLRKGTFLSCLQHRTTIWYLLLVKLQCCTLYIVGGRVLLDMCMPTSQLSLPAMKRDDTEKARTEAAREGIMV